MSIVDTESFAYFDVTLLSPQSLPISVAVSSSMDRLAVLAIEQDQTLQLSYWEDGHQTLTRPLPLCCPKVAASMSLEVSYDEKTLFVAGCDNMDIGDGRPLIAALSFDARRRQKTYIQLSDPNMKNVFRLKRLPGSREDILLASGFKGISIVCYNSHMGVFQELKTLSGLHDGEIFDFCVWDGVIYSISRKDPYIHKY